MVKYPHFAFKTVYKGFVSELSSMVMIRNPLTKENIKVRITKILEEIKEILLTEQKEKIVKNGINVAFCQKIVALSSLFNRNVWRL